MLWNKHYESIYALHFVWTWNTFWWIYYALLWLPPQSQHRTFPSPQKVSLCLFPDNDPLSPTTSNHQFPFWPLRLVCSFLEFQTNGVIQSYCAYFLFLVGCFWLFVPFSQHCRSHLCCCKYKYFILFLNSPLWE